MGKNKPKLRQPDEVVLAILERQGPQTIQQIKGWLDAMSGEESLGRQLLRLQDSGVLIRTDDDQWSVARSEAHVETGYQYMAPLNTLDEMFATFEDEASEDDAMSIPREQWEAWGRPTNIAVSVIPWPLNNKEKN